MTGQERATIVFALSFLRANVEDPEVQDLMRDSKAFENIPLPTVREIATFEHTQRHQALTNDVGEARAVAEFAKGLLCYVRDGNVIERHNCGFVEELRQAVIAGGLELEPEDGGL